MSRRSTLVTVIDVAQAAGVSKSTAARALAGHGSVSAEARRRVTEAAAQLGYRPNALAKAMVSGSSFTIAAVIPDVANPFFSAVVRGLSDAARAAGFEVIISNTDNDPDIEARSIELLAEKRVDGLVVAPVFQEDPRAIAQLISDGAPVVLLDRRMPALADVPLVSIDHVGASRLAVEHLLGLGHERIAIITEADAGLAELQAGVAEEDVLTLRPSSQRLLGYIQALRDRDVPLDPELVIGSDYDARSAAVALGSFLERGTSMTAVYCTDALLTSGAYAEIVERGIDIPERFSFIGFDDQVWTTLVRPSVTVVDQPRLWLGSSTANLLLAQIRGLGDGVENLRLPAKLIRRASTAPVGVRN